MKFCRLKWNADSNGTFQGTFKISESSCAQMLMPKSSIITTTWTQLPGGHFDQVSSSRQIGPLKKFCPGQLGPGQSGPGHLGPNCPGPNCPGPNCPPRESGKLGSRTVVPQGPNVRGPTVRPEKVVSWDPGQLCPRAQMSGAQLSAPRKW